MSLSENPGSPDYIEEVIPAKSQASMNDSVVEDLPSESPRKGKSARDHIFNAVSPFSQSTNSADAPESPLLQSTESTSSEAGKGRNLLDLSRITERTERSDLGQQSIEGSQALSEVLSDSSLLTNPSVEKKPNIDSGMASGSTSFYNSNRFGGNRSAKSRSVIAYLIGCCLPFFRI